MFLDSPDKIQALGCLSNVSPDKSSSPGPKVPDSPESVSSPDEQSELGSYSSLATMKYAILVKLDFDSTQVFPIGLDVSRCPMFRERSLQQDISRH